MKKFVKAVVEKEVEICDICETDPAIKVCSFCGLYICKKHCGKIFSDHLEVMIDKKGSIDMPMNGKHSDRGKAK